MRERRYLERTGLGLARITEQSPLRAYRPSGFVCCATRLTGIQRHARKNAILTNERVVERSRDMQSGETCQRDRGDFVDLEHGSRHVLAAFDTNGHFPQPEIHDRAATNGRSEIAENGYQKNKSVQRAMDQFRRRFLQARQ